MNFTDFSFSRVVVVVQHKVYVYNFEHLDLADSFVTCNNPEGLVSLSTVENYCVLAVPDEKAGHVKVVSFLEEKTTKTIKCHNGNIKVMKLS